MPKVLTSMYQANYVNRCYTINNILDYFRCSYIRIGVLGILSTIPDDLLKVINSKMPEWLVYDDFLKLNVLVKFIKDRVIE